MRRASSAVASFVAVAAGVVVASPAGAQVLFSENFETNNAGSYNVYTSNPSSDASATFGENYGNLVYEADGGDGKVFLPVPVAPHTTGGTKFGLVMRVNDVSNVTNTINAYPKSQNFSGNYKLTFDMWINYNGLATGGDASTEWMVAGINQGAIAGAAGNLGTNTGNTFAQNGETGNGQDYRTYVDQANQNTRGFAAPAPTPQNGEFNPYYSDPATGLFPAPEFETKGASGKHWVTVEISQIAGVITWKIDNQSATNRRTKTITSYPDKTRTSGNITLGYGDFNAGSAAPADAPFQFVVYDNISVEAMPVSLYWDTDGALTAGGGGAAPTGAWDGTALNFNTDSAGAAAGVVTPFTSFNEDVNFAAGADGTGTYTVTVTGSQQAKSVNISRGSVTLDGAGTIATPTISVAAGATALISATLAGGTGGSLTKTGPGTLTVSSANTYAGGTTVSGGTLVLGNADATAGGSINVGNGGLAKAQAGLTKAITVTTLSTNTSGKFDLTNNSLVVKGMNAGQVRTLILGSYNAGHWNGGTGLDSSTAAAATVGTRGIGYATNSSVGNLTTFKGVTGLSGSDVLVKYTYYGDGDLDGDVDGNDVGSWASNFTGSGGSTTKTWDQGDWDYDGDVDGNDVGLWASNFTGSGGGVLDIGGAAITNAEPGAVAMLEAMGFTVVPEPTSFGLLGLAGAGLLARCRRHRDATSVA